MSTQILDGLACNEHGYPLAGQYGVLMQCFDFGQPWGLPGQTYDGGSGETTWDWLAGELSGVVGAAPRKPDFALWWCNGGPTYYDTRIGGRRYCFDAMLHARDGVPATLATDSFDRGGLWETLYKLPQATPGTPAILYLGRMNYPELLALSSAAGKARCDEVLAQVRASGFRGVMVDAASPIGGFGAPSDLSSDTHWASEWVRDHCRLWQSDPSWPVFLSEAWCESSADNPSRVPNRVYGRKAGEGRGLPTGGIWINSAQGREGSVDHAISATNPNRYKYSPPADHGSVWFAVDYVGAAAWQQNSLAPDQTGPARMREWVNSGPGPRAVAVGHKHWGSLSALLPPKQMHAEPLLPTGPAAHLPPAPSPFSTSRIGALA